MKHNFILALAFTLVCFTNLFSQGGADTKAYNNYDFIPGEKILFEDNFGTSQDGEFPPRWNLINGQPVVNKVDGQSTLVFSECELGSSCRMEPAMKVKNYLPNIFTVEFDFIVPTDEDCIMLYFRDTQEEDGRFINFSYAGEITNSYFENELKGFYPNAETKYVSKWHHAALAYKEGQLKIFVDQHRVLVIPKCGFTPAGLYLGGCSDSKVRNVKVAEGGGMNMLGKILTDGKFISHAIKFDVGKSVIKGESMGFLNELVKWLKENKNVKLLIGGHTDSDGDDASNLKLSQARADAVRKQLIQMSISEKRLTAKGYGESKPIQKNDTPDGKANNRRVEFVKN